MSALGRALKPYPPRDVLFDGVAFPTSFVNTSPITVTWKRSQRTKTTITFQTDADETPEVTTNYKVRHGPHDPTLQTVTDLGTGTTGTFNFTWAGLVEAHVYADDGTNQSHILSFQATSGVGSDGVAAGGPIGTANTGPVPGMDVTIGGGGNIGTAIGGPSIQPHVSGALSGATVGVPTGGFEFLSSGDLGTGSVIPISGSVVHAASASGDLTTGATTMPVRGSEEASAAAEGGLGSGGTGSGIEGSYATPAEADGTIGTGTGSGVDGDASGGSAGDVDASGSIGTALGTPVTTGVQRGWGNNWGNDWGAPEDFADVVPHRYWRLDCIQNLGGGYVISQLYLNDETGTNRAPEATLTASSTYMTSYVTYLNDGIGANNWGSVGGNGTDEWVMADFGDGNEVDIRSMGMLSSSGSGGQTPWWSGLSYSDDGSHWVQVLWAKATPWTASETQTWAYGPDVHKGGRDHLYWGFVPTVGNSGDITVATFEVHAEPGSADQCTGGTSEVLKYYFALPSSYMFDNDPSTYWAEGGYVYGVYAWYQFPNKVKATEYLFTSEPSNYSKTPTDFHMIASDDGLSFTVINEIHGAVWTSGGQSQTFPVAAPVTIASGNIPLPAIGEPVTGSA